MTRSLFSLLFLGAALGACSQPSDPALCKGRLAGDLVITEIMSDPEGTDTGKEYLELFNATAEPIDLTGMTLYSGKLDGSRPATHLLREGTVPSGGFFVLGDSREASLPPHLDYSYADGLAALGNSEGLAGIRCGETVLDEVKWSKPTAPAHARTLDGALTPNPVQNDDETHWCEAEDEFSAGSFGSPGFANAACPPAAGSCVDPLTQTVRPVVYPVAGQLVITELMANPKKVTDDLGEWFEVRALADVDLNGLELSLGTSKTVVNSATCLNVPQNGHAVFARNLDPFQNGGIDGAAAAFTFTLAQAAGTLSISSGATVIDSVTYTSSFDGVASQLDPEKLDASLNDDFANFCKATEVYGDGDLGTPGMANTACVIDPGPSNCIDSGTSALRPVVSPGPGELVITELMANPASVGDTLGEWFEVRALTDLDLNGLELSNGGAPVVISGSTCLRLSANTSAVFVRSADSSLNGGITGAAGTFNFDLLNSGGAISINSGSTLIDTVSYTGSVAGVASQLDPQKLDAVSNDDSGNYCLATSVYGDGDKGTPGQDNTACAPPAIPGACVDPNTSTSRASVRANVGDVVLTEFMANPAGVSDTNGEYLELLVKAEVDLNGLELVNGAGAVARVSSASCVRPGAGQYVLVAVKADSAINGGLPTDRVVATFPANYLSNSGGSVSLRTDAGMLDHASFQATPTAQEGQSEQLSSAVLDEVQNDDAGSWCRTSTASRYGSNPDGGVPPNRGTPGLANELCP